VLGIDVGLDGPFSRRPSTMGGSVLLESYCDYLWVSRRTYVIFAGLRSLFESYPLSVSSIPPYRSFTCPSLISSCSVEAAIILFTRPARGLPVRGAGYEPVDTAIFDRAKCF